MAIGSISAANVAATQPPVDVKVVVKAKPAPDAVQPVAPAGAAKVAAGEGPDGTVGTMVNVTA